MAIAEVSVVPLGTKTPSVSQYVARAIKVLEQEKDIKYETTAMGTIIEG
ncbi:MAG: MTH1187 family thiamine-binding protein, partial [Dehalococcoidia bacterium]|nr:MTH1187 family thiamine-binding protein [Dehalococcoidia bacterium]